MLDNIGQLFAYAGVGLVILVVGFYVLDVLTPGKLGALVMEGNWNAALLLATLLVALGLDVWFAIFFTGAGWAHLDDVAVYGGCALVAQVVGFVVLDFLTPGRLGDVCTPRSLQTGTLVASGVMLGVSLAVCASLT